jgi:hypothetical protein
VFGNFGLYDELDGNFA